MSEQAGLTPRMESVYQLLADGARRRLVPSYDEIALHLGLKSKGRVCDIVNQLEQRGYVRRVPGKSRAIEIVGGPWDLPPELVRLLEAYAKAHGYKPGDVVAAALTAFLPPIGKATL